MSLKKAYVKNKPLCKVTFTIQKAAVGPSKKVNLVGEFNNWSISASPMKRNPNGSFSVSLDLQKGKEYQYRYLLDGVKWENDWTADKYVSSGFPDTDNSVAVI